MNLTQAIASFNSYIDRPLAQYFLRRAVLRIPAYRERLEPGDLDALWAYVRWLRGGATAEAGR